MGEQGYVVIYRAVWDHPVFIKGPFAECHAWLWMISTAAWEDTQVRVGRFTIDLKRGELAFSTRFLAQKWQWSEAHVRRFLKRLKNAAMCDALATHKATQSVTHLTICNYNEYQLDRRSERRAGDAAGDAKNNKKEIKKEESKKEPLASLADTRARKTSQPKKIRGQLPETWQPSLKAFELAEQFGQNVQIVEGIFRDYLASSGKRYLDYDAAFHNFIRNQQNYQRGSNHGNGQAAPKRGIIQAADDLCAKIASFDGPAGQNLELCNPASPPAVRLLSQGRR